MKRKKIGRVVLWILVVVACVVVATVLASLAAAYKVVNEE
jgi:cell division protein FtsL